MSSIARTPMPSTGADTAHDKPTLASVELGMRIKLHIMAAVAVVFLSVYGRVVCPFVDSVDVIKLVAGLCAVGAAQIVLREVLFGLFPSPLGKATLARHGMYLAMASWIIAGVIAMALHMALYPSFPLGSHVKLLTGYWALGGGILSQLEFNMLERYLRKKYGDRAVGAQSVEHITRRLMESYAVFTIVPALILVLAVFRQVHEGYGSLPEALEVTFIGVVFVGAALVVAWRYGAALREDCESLREALGAVGEGRFDVNLDATRPDELGMVARGISEMGRDLGMREQRELKLLEVTSAFTDELHLDKLLEVITNGATEIIGAERSSLYLYDEAKDQLWTPVAEGLQVGHIFMPKDAGLAGACFMSEQPLNLADVRQDPRFNQDMDRQTGFETRSMLCMPVTSKSNKRLGVLQVLNRRNDGQLTHFDSRDEQRLRAIAAQAATALENAQLFEDVLNLKNYDESILKSLSNGVVSVADDMTITKVNAAAERILGWREDELTGRHIQDVFVATNQWLVDTANAVHADRQVRDVTDTAIENASRERTSINLSAVPLDDINDECIGQLLILEDLSAEKRVRRTMSRYMPSAVVEQVLEEHRDVLDGRVQTMTLLFTDIRKFTDISEAIGARATVTMLNEYFTEMVDAIDSHGGILDKYIGDAIMALFGVPFESDNDERNALAAANDMMRALHALNTRRLEKGEQPLHHGIGINTGEAVAGNIGSPRRMDYTVIGDAVNLTARIESVTKYYGTPLLVSNQTLDRLGDHSHTREIDRLRVKGKNEPVTLYESFAWRAEHLSDDVLRAYEIEKTALAAFRALDLSTARNLFEQSAALAPDNQVPAVYLERIGHLELDPPEAGWDGVWTMQSK